MQPVTITFDKSVAPGTRRRIRAFVKMELDREKERKAADDRIKRLEEHASRARQIYV